MITAQSRFVLHGRVMCPRLVVVVALAACGSHGGVDDCTLVRDDVEHAIPHLAVRYPANPVRVAQTIERCVAPPARGVDDCQRLEQLVKWIPSLVRGMAGGSGGLAARAAELASTADLVGACRGMPVEMRQCMLPSWALAHPDDCQKVYVDLVASQARSRIDVPAPPARAAPDCEPVHLAIQIGRDGVWLGSGTGARCFARRTGGAAGGAAGGAIDAGWLESELRTLASQPCPPAVEIAGMPGVAYQDVTRAFDVAVKVGLTDPGLTLPGELAIRFSDRARRSLPRHCDVPGSGPPGTSTLAGIDRFSEPEGHGRPAIAKSASGAPVIIVTRQDVSLGGARIASVAEVAAGTGLLASLTQALPPRPTDPTIILQADRDTDMTVINRVVQTASHAGYTAMLFAVKNH
ncbi:MAG TPA: hypothetical protein VFT22_39105 [Kofleriaceae bacterium]|nr:hypothetical protein [Kofleriaceae bacterium]